MVVQYETKKRIRHFVSNVLNETDEGWEVTFLKFGRKIFSWPDIDDIDTINKEMIIRILPDPKRGRRGDTFIFSVDLTNFDLGT